MNIRFVFPTFQVFDRNDSSEIGIGDKEAARMDLLDENIRTTFEDIFESLNARNIYVFLESPFETLDAFGYFTFKAILRFGHTLFHAQHFDSVLPVEASQNK